MKKAWGAKRGIITLKDIKIRTETFNGRLHLVAPVVMLVEGVHNSKLYLEEDLQTHVEAWNGRPVVVYHPEENGIPISANKSPELAERTQIGTIHNAVYENKKLKAEIWIDSEKANQVDPTIVNRINSGESLEVSTGLWFAEEAVSGNWNGEQYNSITRYHVPDHLALLPNEVGACNWEDGCGVRANSETKVNIAEVVDGELALWDIIKKVTRLIENPAGEYEYSGKYVTGVYGSYFIFENVKEDKLYKQEYRVKKNGDIVLKSDPVEIIKKASYETNFDKENAVKKKEKINLIINTKQTGYTEEHKEFLEGLTDEQLEIQFNMAQQFNGCKDCNGEGEGEGKKLEANTDGGEEGEEGNGEEVKNNEGATQSDLGVIPKNNEPVKRKTMNEFINEAPPEIREVLTNSVNMFIKKKEELISGIMANKKNRFTKKRLSEMSMDELDAIADLAIGEEDYSGQMGYADVHFSSNERQEDGTGVPTMPTMMWGEPVNNNKSREVKR